MSTLLTMGLAGLLTSAWAFLMLRRTRPTLSVLEGRLWHVEGTNADGGRVWATATNPGLAAALFLENGGDPETAEWTEVER